MRYTKFIYQLYNKGTQQQATAELKIYLLNSWHKKKEKVLGKGNNYNKKIVEDTGMNKHYYIYNHIIIMQKSQKQMFLTETQNLSDGQLRC